MIFEDDDADRDQHERDCYIGRNRSHADSPTRSIRQQETNFNTGSGSSNNQNRPVRFPERTNKRFVTRKGEDTDGQNHYACHIGDHGRIEWIDFFRYRFLVQMIKEHPAHSQAQWKIEGCSHRRHVVSPVLNVWGKRSIRFGARSKTDSRPPVLITVLRSSQASTNSDEINPTDSGFRVASAGFLDGSIIPIAPYSFLTSM